jgi:hypothetical protein
MGLADIDQARIFSTAADISSREVDGGIEAVSSYIEAVTKKFENLQDRAAAGESELLKSDGTVGKSEDFRKSLNEQVGYVSKSNPGDAANFAHANEALELSGKDVSRLGEEKLLRVSGKDLLSSLEKNPDEKFKIHSAFGMANFDATLNKKLDRSGISSKEMADELDRTDGISRWATSVEAVDGNVGELSEEMLIFDNSLKSLVRSLPEGTKIFDSQAKANEARAKGQNAYSVSELTSEAMSRTGDRTKNLKPVLEKAAATATDITGPRVSRASAKNPRPLDDGKPISQMAEKARADFAKAIPTKELKELSAASLNASKNTKDQSVENKNLSLTSKDSARDVGALGKVVTDLGNRANTATTQAGSGARASRRASAPMGPLPKVFANSGLLSVPGPKGAGDIIPAMLSPGEAVIPAKMAKKYAPFIQDMISGNIPGFFRGGFLGMPKSSKAVAKNRTAADEIYELFKKSSYANTPPTQ